MQIPRNRLNIGLPLHIIFDLDDTLLDTSHHLIPIRHRLELFRKRISEPLPLMPGAWETLNILSAVTDLHLVTQGQRDFQSLKIKNLRITSFFKSITIVEPHRGESKDDIFANFSLLWKVHPSQVWSIGNRLQTDIEPAKKRGYQTIWFRHGEGSDETPSHEQKPDFIVTSHFEILSLWNHLQTR